MKSSRKSRALGSEYFNPLGSPCIILTRDSFLCPHHLSCQRALRFKTLTKTYTFIRQMHPGIPFWNIPTCGVLVDRVSPRSRAKNSTVEMSTIQPTLSHIFSRTCLSENKTICCTGWVGWSSGRSSCAV